MVTLNEINDGFQLIQVNGCKCGLSNTLWSLLDDALAHYMLDNCLEVHRDIAIRYPFTS